MGRILFYLLAGYIVAVALIYLMQRQLQYHPSREAVGAPESYGLKGIKLVEVATEDGLKLNGWFSPPRRKDGNVIVIFHGNAGHIGHRAEKIAHFIEKGYGIYLTGYRGYGGNPGSPSETGFYSDARAALRWLEKEGYDSGKIILYGESIGTGVAVQMAQEIQPKWLVLESPFSTAGDIARISYGWLPVDWLLKDKYDSIAKIAKIKSSLLVVHGDEDVVIPLIYAQKLYETANHPKEIAVIYGGGHSDLYDHHAGHIILEWLEKQGALKVEELKKEAGGAP